jgi:hypothetical protein
MTRPDKTSSSSHGLSPRVTIRLRLMAALVALAAGGAALVVAILVVRSSLS